MNACLALLEKGTKVPFIMRRSKALGYENLPLIAIYLKKMGVFGS